MRATVIGRASHIWVVLLAAAAQVHAQQPSGAPLRKTDLVRFLSGVTLAPDQLAGLIHRNCLSFTPSSRDHADFVALGADSGVLREMDSCARRTPAGHPAPQLSRRAPPPSRPVTPSPAPPPPAPAAPQAGTRALAPPLTPRAPLSPVRTGFIQGVGQHVPVGSRPTLPLLFEIRDTSGAPVPGEEVGLAVTNGHLGATRAVTDSAGRVQVDLTVGGRVGIAVVSATAGALERQATIHADPGPAVKLLIRCGSATAERRISFVSSVPVVLRVAVLDAFGNTVPVTNLQAATGDRGVARIAFVGADSVGGLVRVQPGDEGSTSLVVVASGQRTDLTAVVVRTNPASPPCS